MQGDADAGGEDGEPEERRAFRQRRIQEKHERMQRQVGPSLPGRCCCRLLSEAASLTAAELHAA
jgi:hypothetical protein